MKQSLTILALGMFASMSTFAGPVESVECKYDHRPFDGPFVSISATANTRGNYDFLAQIIPAGRGGGKPFTVSIPSRECDFSDKVPGVFTCTPEGDIAGGDSYKDDQFVTTSYALDPFTGEQITAKIEYEFVSKTGSKSIQEKVMQFDASKCKVVMKVKTPTPAPKPTKAPVLKTGGYQSSDPHAFDRE